MRFNSLHIFFKSFFLDKLWSPFLILTNFFLAFLQIFKIFFEIIKGTTSSLRPWNKTIGILTKFEKTQILSERMTHLSNGCKPYINTDGYDKLYDIALEELNTNKLPYIVKRNIGKNIEYWKLEDLIKP